MYAAAYATIQCTAWAGEWQNRQAGLCGQVLCWPLPPACCCPYPGQAPADLECWARKASWRPAEPVATLQPNPPTPTSTSPTSTSISTSTSTSTPPTSTSTSTSPSPKEVTAVTNPARTCDALCSSLHHYQLPSFQKNLSTIET